MGILIDLTGKRFGKLQVVRLAYEQPRPNGQGTFHFWECLCDCGTLKIIKGANLRTTTRACGCVRRARGKTMLTTHGNFTKFGYMRWKQMMARCFVPHARNYENYGGRGITVHHSYQDFDTFIQAMGPPPSAQHQIDRIDNDGNYEPGNLRWSTRKEQCRNRRNSHFVEHKGQRKTLAEWAEIAGIKQQTFRHKLYSGVSMAELLPQV